MHSHTTLAKDGLIANEVLSDISLNRCQHMHNTRTFSTDSGVIITGLKMNGKLLAQLTEIGVVSANNGNCQGSSFIINGKQYTDALVIGSYSITLKEYHVPIEIESNSIVMPSGQKFNLNNGMGFDIEDGVVIWMRHELRSHCDDMTYQVLYEGPAYIMEANQDKSLVVNTSDFTFAVSLRRPQQLCHVAGYSTDHPKVFVVMGPKKLWITGGRKIQPEDLDLFLYTNSKFVYIERHFRGQLNELYNNLYHKICSLRYNQLHNLISLAYIRPDEFAWAYTKQPGTTALLRGEALYLIKCSPVVVSFRPTTRCYQEIPVDYNNKSMFLVPKSRILKEYAEEIDCNPLAPALYRWENQWYQLQPNPIAISPPAMLSTTLGDTWSYQSTPNLMTSGIYSTEVLNAYQQKLMFPIERDAITYSVAGTVAGRNIESQGLHVGGLLTEATIEELHKSFFRRLYGWYSEFAIHVSGIGGIIMLLYFIESILNMLMNGTLIYRTYGFSYKIFAAIWGTLAKHILIFKLANDAKQTITEDPDEVVHEITKLSPSIDEPPKVPYVSIYPNLPTAPEV
jgi:hypothetical protein